MAKRVVTYTTITAAHDVYDGYGTETQRYETTQTNEARLTRSGIIKETVGDQGRSCCGVGKEYVSHDR